LDPEVSSPLPLPLPLSLLLPLPFLFPCARSLHASPARPRPRGLARPRMAAARPAPRAPFRRLARPRSPRGLAPSGPARPQPRAPARPTRLAPAPRPCPACPAPRPRALASSFHSLGPCAASCAPPCLASWQPCALAALSRAPAWPRMPPTRVQRVCARNCSCAAFDFQLYPFFNFSLVDVLFRALCRATFHFKSSSVDVCRRAFHRATLNVSL
jgi:hypothetical protein